MARCACRRATLAFISFSHRPHLTTPLLQPPGGLVRCYLPGVAFRAAFPARKFQLPAGHWRAPPLTLLTLLYSTSGLPSCLLPAALWRQVAYLLPSPLFSLGWRGAGRTGFFLRHHWLDPLTPHAILFLAGCDADSTAAARVRAAPLTVATRDAFLPSPFTITWDLCSSGVAARIGWFGAFAGLILTRILNLPCLVPAYVRAFRATRTDCGHGAAFRRWTGV